VNECQILLKAINEWNFLTEYFAMSSLIPF